MERSRKSVERIRPVLDAIEKSIDRLRNSRHAANLKGSDHHLSQSQSSLSSSNDDMRLKARAKQPSAFLRPNNNNSEQDRLIG